MLKSRNTSACLWALSLSLWSLCSHRAETCAVHCNEDSFGQPIHACRLYLWPPSHYAWTPSCNHGTVQNEFWKTSSLRKSEPFASEITLRVRETQGVFRNVDFPRLRINIDSSIREGFLRQAELSSYLPTVTSNHHPVDLRPVQLKSTCTLAIARMAQLENTAAEMLAQESEQLAIVPP